MSREGEWGWGRHTERQSQERERERERERKRKGRPTLSSPGVSGYCGFTVGFVCKCVHLPTELLFNIDKNSYTAGLSIVLVVSVL